MIIAFSLDILGLPFVPYFFYTYSCQQNFLEHLPRWQITSTDLGFGEPRRYLSSVLPPGPLWSKLTSLLTKKCSIVNVYPSSNDLLFSVWASGPIYIYIDNELLGPTPLHYQLSHIQINFFFQGNSMVLKTESIKIQKKGLVFSFYGLNHHLLPF